MTGTAAFVLAGGQSRRMGTDKALLDWDGRPLLRHALDLLASVCPQVSIVGAADKFSGYGPVVEDHFLARGPLAGIHAALRSSKAALNLIFAVDLPFVEKRFLEFLIEQARQSKPVVTVPRTADGWQPLCAVYRPEFADVADSALRLGRNKIDPLFAEVDLRVIQENELHNFRFSPRMFRNLNTPEDLEHARQLE